MAPYTLPRFGVKPLLKTVGGKAHGEAAKPIEEPEDITAPPVESSDEEAEEPFLNSYADSSDDEYASHRGDIVASEFGVKSKGKGKKLSSQSVDGTPKRRSARQAGSPNSMKKRAMEEIEDSEAGDNEVFSSNKKAKTTGNKPLTGVGAHMLPGWRLENSLKNKDKGPKPGYGKKAGRSRNATPQGKFRVHLELESKSPENMSTFKTTHLKFEESSPIPERMKPSKIKSGDDISSELSEIDSDTFSDPPRALEDRKKMQTAGKRTTRKDKNKFRQLTPEAVSQKPEFKVPEGYHDYAPSTDLASIDMSLQDTPTDKKRVLGPGLTLCPMCDAVVDQELLKEFSKGQRMTISRQAKFCRIHKKESAKKTWEEKGYPEIDWTKLVKRVAGYHDFIESLIRGASSHFGLLHKEKIKTGKNRTLLKTENYLMPGYYGLRGMSILTETIVETFSSLLREHAPRDRLISARGYTGYVQSVLVPELTVKLIQEDMDVGQEEARSIMKESCALGEILNDEKREQNPRQKGRHNPKDAADKKAISEGEKSDDEVDLKIQAVADSESELSSVASM